MTDLPVNPAELAEALESLSATLLLTVEAADEVVFLLTGKRPGTPDTEADSTADTNAATRPDSTADTKRPVLSIVRDNTSPADSAPEVS